MGCVVVFISAVIAAAGSSQRMGGDKLLMPIGGIPAVVMSVAAFERCRDVGEVIVVTRREKLTLFRQLFGMAGFTKPVRLAEGAQTRQGSVARGLEEVDKRCEYIAIHDGARPLVTPEQISECIRRAVEYGAAALGARVKDTVKRVDADGFIDCTIDRSTLWAVHTPQIFEIGLYRRAMAAALAQGREYTDDCQLVEAVGHRVYMQHGGYENLKLTTPEDVFAADAIARRRMAERGAQ